MVSVPLSKGWRLGGWQYVFREGAVDGERLRELVETVGRKRVVLDLSCRKKVRCSSVLYVVMMTSMMMS